MVPGLGWLATDPLHAHNDYMNSRQVQQAVICGADAGRIRQRTDGCPVQRSAAVVRYKHEVSRARYMDAKMRNAHMFA